MNILESIKIASCKYSLKRLNKKINQKHVLLSNPTLDKTNQKVRYITLNVDKGSKNASYIENIHKLHSNILSNNEYVMGLIERTKLYLADIHDHKLNPRSLDFADQIKSYEDLIFAIKDKKTRMVSLKSAIQQYDQDNYIYREWRIDYDLFESIKAADELRKAFIDKHVGLKTKPRLMPYKDIALQIKKRQKGFQFDISPYTSVLEFYINIDKHISSHNQKFLYDHIKGYYEANKKSKFSLTDYFEVLLSLEDISKKDIEDYFDHLQTNATNDFESLIETGLRRRFQTCKIIRSLYLETNNKSLPTTEIDMILFYKGHIFVIECKDYQGTIFGSYTKDPWLQVIKSSYRYKPGGKLYTQSNSYDVINPVKQNEMHISILNKYVKFDYRNIVLFSDESELKVSCKEVQHKHVFYEMLKTINIKEINTDDIYYQLLLENKGLSNKVKRDHIAAIQTKYVN
ncbi:NERD domain-containing protein [Acholeplasma manati]|uniref:NERD domain-containing protein n=1 Tax=Paracholeplasma manati TaxID=591373 RepID=A0ABT2Y5H3_9MOLU|nr:nuclease-related domain-containing protein [Paracholeplasma manati]MCV2231240.1 NERD domain-containing protein [Paracholeplasma manati]